MTMPVPHLRRAARWAPAIALAIALPLPFFSLPLFALGHWDKAEPLQIWFHLTAALAGLAVALAVQVQGRPALERVAHPYVLLPLSLGLWSAVTAPWHRLPLLTLTGAPQSGFGTLWYLNLAAYCACALLVAQDRRMWNLLVGLAAACGVLLSALKAWDIRSLEGGGPHLLLYVAGYYAWFALSLPLLGSGESRRRILGLLAITALLLAASQAKTAQGAMLLGIVIALAGHRMAIPRPVAAGGVLAAAFLPFAVLHLVPPVQGAASLLDRVLVHRMLFADWAENPAWLMGHGWGRTHDAFQKWLATAGQRLWEPTWTFLGGDYFHSHSWLLESLHAEGAVGVMLTLGGFLAIPWFAAERHRAAATGFAIAYVLFQGLWFELCLSLPVFALALGRVADNTQIRAPLPSRRTVWAVLGALAIAQLGTAAALFHYSRAIGQAEAGLKAAPPRPTTLPVDFRGSDLPAAELIRDRMEVLAARPSLPPEMARSVVWPLLDFVDTRATATPTLLLLTAGLDTMTHIHVTGGLATAYDPALLARWRRWLDRLLAVAPLRADQIIPYVTAALAQGRLDEVDALAAGLLARQNDHPVGLYYQGLVILVRNDPARKAAGLAMIRLAIKNRLDVYMPIDPSLKALLEQPPRTP